MISLQFCFFLAGIFFNILIEFCIYCIKSLISRTFFMFPWTCLKSRILVFFSFGVNISFIFPENMNESFFSKTFTSVVSSSPEVLCFCVFQSQYLRFSTTSSDPRPFSADCSCVQCERGFSSKSFVEVWVDRDSDSSLGGIPNYLSLPALPLLQVCFPGRTPVPPTGHKCSCHGLEPRAKWEGGPECHSCVRWTSWFDLLSLTLRKF